MKSLTLALSAVFLYTGCCHSPSLKDGTPPSPQATSTEEKKKEDDIHKRMHSFPTRARTESLQGDPRPPNH